MWILDPFSNLIYNLNRFHQPAVSFIIVVASKSIAFVPSHHSTIGSSIQHQRQNTDGSHIAVVAT